jgi:hypothetical protein
MAEGLVCDYEKYNPDSARATAQYLCDPPSDIIDGGWLGEYWRDRTSRRVLEWGHREGLLSLTNV